MTPIYPTEYSAATGISDIMQNAIIQIENSGRLGYFGSGLDTRIEVAILKPLKKR